MTRDLINMMDAMKMRGGTTGDLPPIHGGGDNDPFQQIIKLKSELALKNKL
jgi:hypothetical protein